PSCTRPNRKGDSATAAITERAPLKAIGPKCGSASRMNMKEAPHIAASEQSISSCDRVMGLCRVGGSRHSTPAGAGAASCYHATSISEVRHEQAIYDGRRAGKLRLRAPGG